MTYLLTLATLFIEYFLTGLFAVGGGLATLPFLTQMSARHPEWFTTAQLTDMVAVSESTPGPLGINMSTYVGYRVAGIPGAIVAVFALVLPSVIIVLILSRVLAKYMKNRHVQNVFYGIRPAVTGLIAAAGWLVLREVLFTSFPAGAADFLGSLNVGAVIIFLSVLLLALLKPLRKLHPVVYIALAAAAGVVFRL